MHPYAVLRLLTKLEVPLGSLSITVKFWLLDGLRIGSGRSCKCIVFQQLQYIYFVVYWS